MAREPIYTRDGDDGTTGLFYGGRVPKDSALPRAYGTVDEAQAVLGLARSAAVNNTGDARSQEVVTMLEPFMRDLWVLMAELATLPENRHKLVPEKSCVSAEMVTKMEQLIDQLDTQFEHPTEFVVPGEHPVSALCAVQNVIHLLLRHRLRTLCHTSIACPTCCGPWHVGKRVRVALCAAFRLRM